MVPQKQVLKYITLYYKTIQVYGIHLMLYLADIKILHLKWQNNADKL